MVTRIGGSKHGSRQKFKKYYRTKGKVSIKKFLQTFDVGDKVCLKAEPAVQKGCYHIRFHGKIGQVAGKRGFCYLVDIKDHTKKKSLIVHPIHLTKVI